MITTYKQSLDKILEEERKSKDSLASAEVEKYKLRFNIFQRRYLN